jgi:hypothetical protein
MFKQKFVQIGGPPSSASVNMAPLPAATTAPTTLGAKTQNMQQSNTLMGQMKLGKPATSTSLMSSGGPMTLSKLKELKEQQAAALKAETPEPNAIKQTELSPNVTGILLLMLEDDSMAVR